MLQKIKEISLQSYVFPSLFHIYTSRRIHARTLPLFLSLSPFFLPLSLLLTCAVAETSTASYRRRRSARSNPATAYARIAAGHAARWTAACSFRAGDRIRGRLCAHGRPCQPSWPSFRRVETAAGRWLDALLDDTVAAGPRDGAWRFRHPFARRLRRRRPRRPINTCPPRIRGSSVCATTAAADAVVTPSVDVDSGGGGDANRSDDVRRHLCERRRGLGMLSQIDILVLKGKMLVKVIAPLKIIMRV